MWVVPVAEVLNERSGHAPGTIVRPDGAGFVVATGSSDVLLPRLMQPGGTPANPDEAWSCERRQVRNARRGRLVHA